MPVIPSSSSYTVTTSGKKIIKRALRLLGAIASGDEIEAQDLADGLEALNGMLDTWNTDSLMVPSRQQIEKALDGSASYTIGEDSNYDIVGLRPEDIRQGDAYIRYADGRERELEIYDHHRWGRIWNKSYSGTWPCVLYYDKAFPAGNINLWPVASSGTLILHQEKKLAQISSPSVLFSLEPAYYEAICYNLAVRLAPEYGAKTPPEVVAVAQSSIVAIKRANMTEVTMSCDPALLNSCSLEDYGLGYGGGATTPSPSISTISADGNVPSNQIWLVEECTGGVSGITRTLPAPDQAGSHIVTFIKMDADAAGSVTIAGTLNVGSSYVLVNQNQNVTFISDGYQWVIQSAN